jgi:hypothetical protein
MQTANGTHVFEQLLDPVGRCLTPDVARSLLKLRAPAAAQARIEALADKCTSGALTPEEESEYDAYVWAGNLIAILQTRARALLAAQT